MKVWLPEILSVVLILSCGQNFYKPKERVIKIYLYDTKTKAKVTKKKIIVKTPPVDKVKICEDALRIIKEKELLSDDLGSESATDKKIGELLLLDSDKLDLRECEKFKKFVSSLKVDGEFIDNKFLRLKLNIERVDPIVIERLDLETRLSGIQSRIESGNVKEANILINEIFRLLNE